MTGGEAAELDALCAFLAGTGRGLEAEALSASLCRLSLTRERKLLFARHCVSSPFVAGVGLAGGLWSDPARTAVLQRAGCDGFVDLLGEGAFSDELRSLPADGEKALAKLCRRCLGSV